jgi:hypothetical protein
MTPIRTSSPFIPAVSSQNPSPTAETSEAPPTLHAAVANRDAEALARLRKDGQRANTLNAEGHSPLDVLDKMRDIDERSRSGLRMALLQSLNPTAPLAYAKPEALHGTPWGLEILQSGALKGGVNDAKGGTQSLEGQVFFSDRTPERATDTTTRENLRSKARDYAAGDGIHTSNARSRALQHRMAQIILHALNTGKTLPANAMAPTINVADPEQLPAEGAAWLQRFLHASYINKLGSRKFVGTPLEEHLEDLKMPGSIGLNSGGQVKELRGDDLNRFYHQAASELVRSLEDGKAPYLGVLNQGGIVPLVFGFEKINNLATHEIQYRTGAKQYSYQNKAHPLSGSPENGGKLKELEVRSLDDFATLCLGCAIKGIELPADLVVRVKGQSGEKARYLDASHAALFRAKLAAEVADHAGDAPLGTLDLHQLQRINSDIRAKDLSEWLPV